MWMVRRGSIFPICFVRVRDMCGIPLIAACRWISLHVEFIFLDFQAFYDSG